MQITSMPIDGITPYENNPRLNKKAISKVADSLKEYGWQQPIVVDQDNVIIVGHTRYEAAKKLKHKEVPVHVATGLTDEQVKAYRIADNRTGEDAAWDMDLLKLEITGLDAGGMDLSLTGFSTLEIDEMFKEKQHRKTDVNDIPSIETIITTQPGDMWQLGDHVLICGDSTKRDTYDSLMGKQKADMVWTDPPYNINYESADGKSIMNDHMPDEVFKNFLNHAFKACLKSTKKGGAIYIAHADTEGTNFRQAMVESGWALKQCLIWVKDHFTLGCQDYQWQHEPILYGWKPGGPHKWHGTFCHTTVQDGMKDLLESMEKDELLKMLQAIYRDESTIIRIDKPKKSAEHPTMKPVALMIKLIKNSSARNNIVLEPFGGSGSTLMACEDTGRRCRCIELDPKYCDVIIRRWQDYTGEYATLKGTGEYFNKRADNE